MKKTEKDMSQWDGLKKAMLGIVNELSADRPQYFQRFMNQWECCRDAVDWLAEAITKGCQLECDQNFMEKLVLPYEMITLLVFARLMDHLEYEEEDRLREVVGRVDAAWQKLTANITATHPNNAALGESIANNHSEVQRIVLDLFSGELPPVLRSDWSHSLKALQADLAALVSLNNERAAKPQEGEVQA